MAVLTVTNERLREVEVFAKVTERSQEEVVDEAIGLYLRKQKFERACAGMREWVDETGLTKEDLAKEIRLYRGEAGEF
jgi:hypothetical protein